MALDRNFVWQFAEFAREQIQQFFTILIWSGATEIEKVPVADSRSSIRNPSGVTVISI
jgi:hypothetical protein